MSSSLDAHTIRSVDFDIDAREAEIIGKPQRITSLKVDELGEEAMQLVTAMRQSLDSATTHISDVFGLMLRHPGLFECQMNTALQLIGKGMIGRRDRELAILRVAWWCRAPFEWGEHVRVAKRYDITEEEIARVRKGSAAPGWSEHERAVLRGVEELLGDQMITDATWEILARTWDDKQLIEFPYLVGQYFLTALQQNSLRVALDKFNIGLHQNCFNAYLAFVTSPESPYMEIPEDVWDRVIRINLKGPHLCCREVMPDMLAARWGRIINITSSSTQTGAVNMVHYVASKGGLLGMTKALAREYAAMGITVNMVPPGFIDTPMLRASGVDIDAFAATLPMKRAGKPEDIAAACAFLASEEASYMTGQTISTNGGRYMGSA